MKRFLHRLSLLFVVLLLLTTAVFADMGPKPQLTVVVEHAPSELYYLDLLAEGEYEYDPDFAMDETDLDPELLAAFRAAIPDGWHACIAEGTTGAPIWGETHRRPCRTHELSQLPLLRRPRDIPHSDRHGLRRDVFVGRTDTQDAPVLCHGRLGGEDGEAAAAV